jgi:hypothetical protein
MESRKEIKMREQVSALVIIGDSTKIAEFLGACKRLGSLTEAGKATGVQWRVETEKVPAEVVSL